MRNHILFFLSDKLYFTDVFTPSLYKVRYEVRNIYIL